MQSLAAATRLLDNCLEPDGLVRLLIELGFDRDRITLSQGEAQSVGLPCMDGIFSVLRGPGAMRAVTFDVERAGQLREEIARNAARLLSRAPHLSWIVAARDPFTGEVAIAASRPDEPRGRVAALVVKRGHIVGSDAETICALSAATAESDITLFARWLEILGRESVSRRFFRALEAAVSRLARDLEPAPNPDEAAELALLYASRLLFLSFLETKGWLNRDHGFLGNGYADCMVHGGGYHRRVLVPLFFGTLNTTTKNRAKRAQSFGRIPFLNGGLFSRSGLERRLSKSRFSDEALGNLFGDVLARYRFTAREDSASWSEVAIDPEMLGRAFESLMSAKTRKTSGAFYTPQSLVVSLTRSALLHSLTTGSVSRQCVETALSGEPVSAPVADQMLTTLGSFRALDPACGSGAFLVHLLEELSRLRRQLGDSRPLHEIRRAVLTGSIFGVDINPTAVWLCELRLWLSMAIENPQVDPMRVATLPNLDRNIRVGDSLLADSFVHGRDVFAPPKFTALRSRYARATGPRKRSLGRMLDKVERRCAIEACLLTIRCRESERRELLLALRSPDLFGERRPPSREIKARLAASRAELKRTNSAIKSLASGAALPFSFATHFADVAARGGFDAIVGNPPWIRTHNLPLASRVSMRDRYSVYRNAAWQSGAESAGAGRGFSGQVDTAALFIERSLQLTRLSGVVGLIVPAKLWRSLAGGGVRSLLRDKAHVLEIHDLTDARHVFDAAVYPSLIIARRTKDAAVGDRPAVAVAVHGKGDARRWDDCARRVAFDDTNGSPWVLIPPDARSAFAKLGAAGVPLSRTRAGRPMLGVKTGCNEAFIPPPGKVEQELLRPLVRGETVSPWQLAPPIEQILWTHDATGRPLTDIPPRAEEWLSGFRRELEARSDVKRHDKWWSLFRTESADFCRPRVVWSDVARSPAAAVIEAGDNAVAINSCYVVRCPTMPDALTLAALLNSPIAAAWLNQIAEPARGGYHRYLGWTMSLLPLPRDWPRARSILCPIASRALDGSPPDPEELSIATLEAFGLSRQDVMPLLTWNEL